MTYRFRYLHPDDQARWPDWYSVDVAAMDEMDTGVLLDWEAATGYLALAPADSPQSVGASAARRELRALLAIQYLAVRLAGVAVRWEEFRPKVLQVEVDRAPEPPPAEAGESGNSPGPANRRATRRASSASAAATSPRPRKAAGRRASGS